MAQTDAWALVPGDNGPTTAAPGTTRAVHFVKQLVENAAQAGTQPGLKMQALAMHLLEEQGWETVEDIRNSLTEPMLTAAIAQLDVGAGYAKQFQKYLGAPDSPWVAKKPEHQKRKEEWEPTKPGKEMKFAGLADANPVELTPEVVQGLVVPDTVFKGVFGENILVVLPHGHVLTRLQCTEVVNRYVMFVVTTLHKVEASGALLAALTRDFKSKFPFVGSWGGKPKSHVKVLRNGFRNRRNPPTEESYKGLKMSEADMEDSQYAQALADAGFPLKVGETDTSYSAAKVLEVNECRVVGFAEDEVNTPPLTPPQPKIAAVTVLWLLSDPPLPPQSQENNGGQQVQTKAAQPKTLPRRSGMQPGAAGGTLSFKGLTAQPAAAADARSQHDAAEAAAPPKAAPAKATKAAVLPKPKPGAKPAATPAAKPATKRAAKPATKPAAAAAAKPAKPAAEPTNAVRDDGMDDDLFLSPKERAEKFGSSDDWKFYQDTEPPLEEQALPFEPRAAIGRTFILPFSYPPFATHLYNEKAAFIGWMGAAA